MPAIKLDLRLDSPAFLAGADKSKPEFRAASVRGQLRYWARALAGAQVPGDLKRLWQAESAAFGSTGQGAPVMVRIAPLFPVRTEKAPMLPHRSDEGRQTLTDAIADEQKFRIVCQTRPAVALPPLFEQALMAWLLFGGFGRRSRRMFGSPGVNEATGFSEGLQAFAGPWQTIDDYRSAAKALLQSAIAGPPASPPAPRFPTLHPKYSHVLVGANAFDDAAEANGELFGLLRGNKYREHGEKCFGRAMGGRRASPLIAQVRKIGGSHRVVLTYLLTEDLVRHKEIVNAFMKDSAVAFKAETVWGGEFQ